MAQCKSGWTGLHWLSKLGLNGLPHRSLLIQVSQSCSALLRVIFVVFESLLTIQDEEEVKRGQCTNFADRSEGL